MVSDEQIKQPTPPYKRLRAFAFDPSLSRQIETQDINEVTLKLPWDSALGIGPVDTYLEVVDYDPASQAFYPPVDLNDSNLTAQDGLPPSESNPQFHQQMAYAVARMTISHFEQALGRKVLWSVKTFKEKDGYTDEYIPRLRIYPHAMRDANAYYSPDKKALLFGYFPASSTDPGQNMPGETVFTCVCQDIVAHETTHAIIDGIHPRFIEPSNMDVWALHEAIADIVALFLHFTYPEVLRSQIVRTRGDLENQSLLGELAYQFGQAIGNYGALRSAIGRINPDTHKWEPAEPDPKTILTATEPHDRGAIMVAAIFDAYLAIYKSRIRDLLRIASGGTGVLQPGEIHPDLVERLAQEATKTAKHMLQVCIRALDYCTAVDTDFGDYLRAIITADAELVTDDPHNYRLAIIEAFRRRGIYPRDVRNLSVESLMWHRPTDEENQAFLTLFTPERLKQLLPDPVHQTDREKMYNQTQYAKAKLHSYIMDSKAASAVKAAHLIIDRDKKDSIYRDEQGVPTLEFHSLRPARRIGPDGQTVEEFVVEITQRRRGYLNPEIQKSVDSGEKDPPPAPDFIFRGGCTLLVDINTAKVRFCIYQNILSEDRMNRMREFLQNGMGPSLHATYFGDPCKMYYRNLITRKTKEGPEMELFALLHKTSLTEGV